MLVREPDPILWEKSLGAAAGGSAFDFINSSQSKDAFDFVGDVMKGKRT